MAREFRGNNPGMLLSDFRQLLDRISVTKLNVSADVVIANQFNLDRLALGVDFGDVARTARWSQNEVVNFERGFHDTLRLTEFL